MNPLLMNIPVLGVEKTVHTIPIYSHYLKLFILHTVSVGEIP